MERFEKHVQINTSFVALVLLKRACNDRSWETGLVPGKGVGLGVGGRILLQRGGRERLLPAANCDHVRGHGQADGRSEAVDSVSVDWKPEARVEQVTGIGTHIG